jgi:enoyl-CoA hydratase/carnithine racemase
LIHWERDGRVGVAVIDRPERRNALNAELCDDLRARLEASHDLRAVVIGGAGDKAFCAGADLGRRAADLEPGAAAGDGGLEHGGGDTFRPAFEAMLDAVVAHPAPVVAAVNGPALGAGMQLAVACDLRVVAPHATFGIPAARLGVLVSSANVARLAALVGPGPARDILLTARVLTVDDALPLGLVQRRADDALAAARVLAAELAAFAPLSASGHKRALNLVAAAAALPPEATTELATLEAAAFASEDLQEGLAAFAEKRAPRFEGR